jgi:hypothetical protein
MLKSEYEMNCSTYAADTPQIGSVLFRRLESEAAPFQILRIERLRSALGR